MTYRDMTFCTGEGCAAYHGCSRAYTQEIKEAAREAFRRVALMSPSPSFSCYIPEHPENRPEEVAVS